jgi:hypothetical protein
VTNGLSLPPRLERIAKGYDGSTFYHQMQFVGCKSFCFTIGMIKARARRRLHGSQISHIYITVSITMLLLLHPFVLYHRRVVDKIYSVKVFICVFKINRRRFRELAKYTACHSFNSMVWNKKKIRFYGNWKTAFTEDLSACLCGRFGTFQK